MRVRRRMYNPDGFRNIEKDGTVIGYEFQFKVQYHRGIPVSNVRDIQIWVDGEPVARDDIRFTLQGTTFTLKEMREAVETKYCWEYGDYATVSVMRENGLTKGSHHIKTIQCIAPPFSSVRTEALCEAIFIID